MNTVLNSKSQSLYSSQTKIKEDYAQRKQYYQILSCQEKDDDGNTATTYGLHQSFECNPLPGNFTNAQIYNNFGYDVVSWYNRHCQNTMHYGTDFVASKGTNVYSLMDGKVESIDTSNHTIVIAKSGKYLKNKREVAILNFISKQIKANQYPPSVREICKAVGLNSTATVHGYLEKLEQKGYIRKESQKGRALRVVNEDDVIRKPKDLYAGKELVDVPVVGKITAGAPILAPYPITTTSSSA